MIARACLASGLLLLAHPALAADDCLSRVGTSKVLRTDDGALGQQYRPNPVGPGEENTIIDARAKSWLFRSTSGSGAICSAQGAPNLDYPVNLEHYPGGCAAGGTIFGAVNPAWVWQDAYCNGAAVRVASSENFLLENWRIDRAWDGIRPSSAGSIIRDVWLSNTRDDCLEQDTLEGFTLTDALLDGCHAGISASKKDVTPPGANGRTTSLDRVLIRLEARPFISDTGERVSISNVFYKTSDNSAWPALSVKNSIFAADYISPTNSDPWQRQWAAMAAAGDCENNAFLYLGNNYTVETLPSHVRPLAHGGDLPACFTTVLAGADARVYWETHKRRFIREKTGVIPRMPGDPADRISDLP
jgi:hypothetical protein